MWRFFAHASTDFGVWGWINHLKGLEENIIVGRLIPAGAGLMVSMLGKIANASE